MYSGEYVAPEYLLIALLREADTEAARLLAAHGLTIEEARNYLSDLD